MIAGIEDDVFDRFARLQDRTDKPLELTASRPDPDRRTLARLRDRGAYRALVWLPQDAGGAISDSDTGTIPRRRRGQHHSLSEVEAYRSRFRGRVHGQTMRSALRAITSKMRAGPGRRHDDEREPNGRAVQRAAAQQRRQDLGAIPRTKQAGQQLRGADPLG
jgi:hypothetical protein